jgi:hypothetical protein
VIGGLTEEERVRWAIETNALRRHLSAKERRSLLETYIQAAPDRSTRETADLLRISPRTVGNAKARLIAGGQICPPETIRGRDGKSYKPAYSAETRQQAQEAASILSELGDAAPPGGASLRKLRHAAYQARAKRDADGPAGRLPANIEVHQCDFRLLERHAGDLTGKVALACLDPPWSLEWAKEHLDDLVAMTARVLRPGGICSCYVGRVGTPRTSPGGRRAASSRWSARSCC